MRDRSAVRALLYAFSQIVLQRHAGCGALVMLALAIGAPALLAGALFGVLTAHIGAAWLHYRTADRDDGLYGYNAALLGALLVGRLGLSTTSLALVALAALASCLLQSRLLERLHRNAGLPGFTLPFVLIGLIVMLANPSGPAPAAAVLSPTAMTLLEAWLLGIGQVLFIDEPLAASCMLLGVALACWRAAAWLLAGSALGLVAAGLLGAAWMDGLAGLNPALAALALAQWRGGWRLPLLGMTAAVLFWLVGASLGLPMLTLPFLLATWLGLLACAPRPWHGWNFSRRSPAGSAPADTDVALRRRRRPREP